MQNPNNVVMTYYHGPHGERVVFSGFNFWSFRRDGCVQLVDFVLQQIWHLSRGVRHQVRSARCRAAAHTMKSILLTTVLIAAGVTVAGCGRKLNGVMPNQPPAIGLSGAPVAIGGRGQPLPGEVVGHRRRRAGRSLRRGAVDPPSVDRVDEHWTITHELQQVVAFPASAVRGARDEGAGTAPRTPHVVAVRADRRSRRDVGGAEHRLLRRQPGP